MMLQIQKKLNYKNNTLKRIILLNSLVAIFCTGLFAFNVQDKYISNTKNSKLLLKPINDLNDEEYDKFMLGRSFFTVPWVKAPSITTARDGLGPLFNANSCISCHPNNGRGLLFSSENIASRAIVARLSITSDNSLEHKEVLNKKGYIPEPVYGNQLAINSIFGVDFEGKVNIDFEEKEILFPDGEKQILLKPKYSLKELNYGDFHKNGIVSYRIAQTLNGMGLIDLISDEDIIANEDIDDKNGDGISGKANWVYSNITKKIELGKYTWKASVAFLKEQVAFAASNDIGLTTTIFQDENCTKFQKTCNEAPKAKDIDLPDNRLDAITYYLKNIKSYSPVKTKEYKDGFTLFESISCSKCHISSFKTNLGFEIYPFSDFLLHDMGEELSDGRVEFLANEREWRTAPLWGLALHEKINKEKPRLLHDGRARSFQEAILWHGGEAENAKKAYMNLPKEQREKLIKFLEEL
ncbi:thiol oxidoreductase [Aliarcobacter vitoriensis]|uniref:Thiol oxidoreductase n=1 Tax=Aliarcobacter vitoriensis TaxID=2011099 RepID=A0A366MRN4_9BACT|nr:thiol oxidoreductase [Aliarcobacter vitoriensis]